MKNSERIEKILKDKRVILYLISTFIALIYLLYSFFTMKVVVEESPIIPSGSIIFSINDCKVKSIQDFYSCIPENGSAIVKTDRGNYFFNEKELDILRHQTRISISGNIKLGIDFGGGYLIILKSSEEIPRDQLFLAQKVLENRLNSLGLKALNLYVAGNNYLIVQIPSAEKRLIEIIKQQGHFEAKIKNVTVIAGQDIINIITSPPNAGLEGCTKDVTGYYCSYYFTLVLSKEAAKKFSDITRDIPISLELGGRYLTEKIYFYLDNSLVSELYIDSNLRGVEASQVLIKVSGSGKSEREAAKNAIEKARELQIVLGSGSLPTKFEIEQISYISPQIATKYIKDFSIAAIFSLIFLAIVIFLSYKNIKAASLIYIPMLSEVLIAISIAVAVGQTIDLAAILGIFLGVATGMDDNLVIVNDILRGKKELKIEKSIKKILFIIFTAIFTEIFAFIPMLFSNVALGLFRGFAFMTIVTSLTGFFITRPAYLKIANELL